MAFLIFCSFGGRELHELLFHHHDENVSCEAQDGVVHLHGEEYLPDHCFLCTLNTTELSVEESTFTKEFALQTTTQNTSYQNPTFRQHQFSFLLRGPPVLNG